MHEPLRQGLVCFRDSAAEICILCIYIYTLPKFNIAPEKCWLEDHFPIGKATFQGLC